jgi:hypothetical protein
MGTNSDSIPRRVFLSRAFVAAAAVAVHGFVRPGALLSGTAGPPPPSATESLEDLYRGLELYWGDLHAHTGYSDGFGTPPASFEYGRNQQGLDFCALTDHAEWIGFFQSRLRMADGSPLPLWANLIAEVEARYAPGAFVPFPGYEWTSDEHGHRTVVFGRTDPLPEVPPSTTSHRTPEELWTALAPYTAMTIPHHVTRWGRLMDWSRYNPALDRLVEIYSKWGNGASAWTSYEPPTHYMQYPFLRGQAAPSGVDAMLALGHRIGIIASTDSHQGHPGSTAPDERLGIILPPAEYPTTGEDFLEALEQGYTVDHREPAGGGGGLAAVWATELTREAIWEGLYGRRTFATSGARPVVKFGVCDGAIPGAGGAMGGEISVVGAPTLLASAVPEPGSSITHIALLKTNAPLLTVTNPAPGVAVSFQDDALAVGETACYRAMVFITQEQSANRDGDTILTYDRGSGFFQSSEPRLDEQVWTSPVWVTRAGP